MRKLFTLFLLLICSSSYAFVENDVDLFKHSRFGFGLGFASLNYKEERQFQPSLSSDGIAFSGPLLWAKYTVWMVRDYLDCSLSGEVMGTAGERIEGVGACRLHQFWNNHVHTSVAVGPYSTIRFVPEAYKGYSNLWGAYVEPRIGFRWNELTSYPQEVSIWGRLGKPFFGGKITVSESHEWMLGADWRIPVMSPPAFPTIFFERVLILGFHFENTTLNFKEVRNVQTSTKRFVFSLGYEY